MGSTIRQTRQEVVFCQFAFLFSFFRLSLRLRDSSYIRTRLLYSSEHNVRSLKNCRVLSHSLSSLTNYELSLMVLSSFSYYIFLSSYCLPCLPSPTLLPVSSYGRYGGRSREWVNGCGWIGLIGTAWVEMGGRLKFCCPFFNISLLVFCYFIFQSITFV